MSVPLPSAARASSIASAWSVTARGFNSPETANKLLGLIDGRSVYEPIGSGVLLGEVFGPRQIVALAMTLAGVALAAKG